MQRVVVLALLASAAGTAGALAQPMPIAPSYYSAPAYGPPPPPPAQPQYVYQAPPNLGGGFIEFLFGGQMRPAYQNPAYQNYEAAPQVRQPSLLRPQLAPDGAAEQMVTAPSSTPPMVYARTDPAIGTAPASPARPGPDPRFLKQVVRYDGEEKPGTIIIDTPRRFLFLVEGDGKALRYGIGVGRPGFTWAGVKQVTAKREWPDWRPPEEMLQRRPDLPSFMAGGPENPLGARALYLGSSLYRIHGSNEPWTIGQAVSSGCIRMRNEDVIDLYERVKVGTKVVVI